MNKDNHVKSPESYLFIQSIHFSFGSAVILKNVFYLKRH